MFAQGDIDTVAIYIICVLIKMQRCLEPSIAILSEIPVTQWLNNFPNFSLRCARRTPLAHRYVNEIDVARLRFEYVCQLLAVVAAAATCLPFFHAPIYLYKLQPLPASLPSPLLSAFYRFGRNWLCSLVRSYSSRHSRHSASHLQYENNKCASM